MGFVAYVGERFVDDPSNAVVSIWDRGYLLGDGVFETLRAYEGVPFALAPHLDRLARSARAVAIPMPRGPEETSALVGETLRRSGLRDAYVRVTLTRGPGKGGLATVGCGPATLSILVQPRTPYPAEAFTEGVESVVVRLRRVPSECLDSSIKSTNYLPQIQARRELEELGLLEGIQLGTRGDVVGGVVSNVFLARGSDLLTPFLESGCLPGITRSEILAIAAKAGLDVKERAVTVADVEAADELFFCGTLIEILPVRSLRSGPKYGPPGAVTCLLRRAFAERVSEYVEQALRARYA